MRFDAVIFDLDGTLTDSAPGLYDCIRVMHDEMGWEAPAESDLRFWLGPPVSTTLGELGYEQSAIEQGLAIFRRHLHAEGLQNNSVYQGVPELLSALTEAGIPSAVATFKIDDDAQRVIDHFTMRERFAGVHGRLGDEAGHSKAPVIARAMESIGIEPSQRVAMVGDRKHDASSALELGLTPIGVTYGYGDVEELRNAGAVHIVDSVDALRNLLLDTAE
ncbi:HAD hydrolase-like protein [Humidisolicoccus flavus]|uniref:HAD hydrolase-like protein n=1 Tax=Humidisolicoccus flavus TaxID=3111414 RepID=UPI0032524E8F